MSEKKLRPLLVVEDNKGLQKQLKWAFEGYDVHIAGDREAALSALREYSPHVVTLDLGLPPDTSNATEGLRTLQEILQIAPDTKVIVVTGNDDREIALQAVSEGAYDFYQKPVEPEVLSLIVDRAYALFELEEENRKLQLRSRSTLDGIIGTSDVMMEINRLVEKVGPSEATTLVLGESGTGKELIARALHDLSDRKDRPFVALNCAAIPENLLESELFGYEKGAFTGAIKQTPGKIESTNGGTFFLDEIGDMPMSLQAKMLRFLQERVVERIGGRSSIPVDVRIVCATHHDLEKLISEGMFREDLYFRISEIVINLPALRDRGDDKFLLAQSFLDRLSVENKRRFKGFTSEARAAIDQYGWPGNVREMENKIKRAVVLADGNRITAMDVGLMDDAELDTLDLRYHRENVERDLITRALAIHNNNVSHAAAALGISRPSLYSMVKKLGLPEPGKQ